MKKSHFKATAKQSSGFLLWQVTTLWQREIKIALEPLGLSHSGFVLLASLLWFEEQDVVVTQTTLIEHTKLDKMTVSKSLKVLERNGFVLRTENEQDTRAKTILLSNEGRSVAIESVKVVEGVDGSFFSAITAGERDVLNGLFLKLQD